ncbi:hypothetical protein D3C86_1937110 [compost metagenome]
MVEHGKSSLVGVMVLNPPSELGNPKETPPSQGEGGVSRAFDYGVTSRMVTEAAGKL